VGDEGQINNEAPRLIGESDGATGAALREHVYLGAVPIALIE
jgi:hypothetical protein